MSSTRRFFSLAVLLLFFLLAGCASQGGKALEKRAPESRAPEQPRQAAELRQQQANADLQKAEAYLQAKDYPQAKALFKKVFSAAAHLPAEAHYQYGYVLNRTGDYQAAIEQFALYTEEVNSGQGHYREAMEEWSFAHSEIGRLEALEQQQAAEQEKQRQTAAAQQALQPIAPEAAQQLKQAVSELAPEIVEPLTGMELLLVPGGCFSMGDHFGDGDESALPLHEVCLGDFYLGKYEVTQGQWQALMGYNPAQAPQGEQYPVDQVSWQEAQGFLQVLNRNGASYRLPTEAEWEYAARSGGRQERFSGGAEVDALAWYQDNSDDSIQPVGQKQANGLGLYDMSGNVAEWCQDYRGAGEGSQYYQQSPKDNPTGPLAGREPPRRRVRGGKYLSPAADVSTSTRRSYQETGYRSRGLGFRVALPVTPTASP